MNTGLERAGRDFEKLKDKNEDAVLHSKIPKQSIVPKNEELKSIENT